MEVAAKEYEDSVLLLPNMLDSEVPTGKGEEENQVIFTKGEITKKPNHYDLNIIDHCVDLSGSRFVHLSGKIATLERALGNFFMDHLIERGFVEQSLPSIVNAETLLRSRHLPKSKDDIFWLTNGQCLVPTAEATLVNLGLNKKFSDVPVLVANVGEAFREEAGSAGKDTKGIVRVHQFKKCEMVAFAYPEKSEEVHQFLLKTAKEALEKLELPYRVILLCSGDTGFASAKTYDIEAPIGKKWREISSISNCKDFQAIAINAKTLDGRYMHMLNGTCFALGRLVAVISENNFVEETKEILIPKALIPYTKFDRIKVEI